MISTTCSIFLWMTSLSAFRMRLFADTERLDKTTRVFMAELTCY